MPWFFPIRDDRRSHFDHTIGTTSKIAWDGFNPTSYGPKLMPSTQLHPLLLGIGNSPTGCGTGIFRITVLVRRLDESGIWNF